MARPISQPAAGNGQWVRGNRVGAGSFGVVNLAMNRSTGELFVAKSAPACSSGSESLENEFEILRSLDSPHVVRCLGREVTRSGDGDEMYNLFLEYMAGGSLSEILSKFGGSLDESVVRCYTREIVQAMAYLHGNGIVHGDIKCKNVLLGSSGNVKLADFGSARKLDSASDSDAGSISGTPLWMAPEVLRRERLGLASDIWSLGCTIIEMATGLPPWSRQLDSTGDPLAAVFKIACGGDTPHLPANFSKEGRDFLRKCLRRNPRERWTCRQLLDHPFITGRLPEVEVAECPSAEETSTPTSVLDAVVPSSPEWEPDSVVEFADGGREGSGCDSSWCWSGADATAQTGAWIVVRSR